MRLRNLKLVEFLTLALLALAGAGVCRIGWSGPTLRLAESPGNSEIAALRTVFAILRKTRKSWCAGGGLGRR